MPRIRNSCPLILVAFAGFTARSADNYISGKGRAQPDDNEVRIHSYGPNLEASWLAYTTGTYGTLVSNGDIDNDGLDNAITGPGPGPVHGPHVKAFQPSGAPVNKVTFYAYGTLKFGVNVAGGNMDADPYDEIVTGAGPGAIFAPHVRGWNYDNQQVAPLKNFSFLAFSTLKYGAVVATAQLLQDNALEIMVSNGPDPGMSLLAAFDYDGSAITSIGSIGGASCCYGYNVSAAQIDGDAFDEYLLAPGPSAVLGAQVRGFNFDGVGTTAIAKLNFYAFNTMYGARLAAGDIDPTLNQDELVIGPGEDPTAAANVRTFTYGSGIGTLPGGDFLAFGSSSFGVVVGAGNFGY
ncbi:MAG: hypothetical protein U0166_23885 [Acidobacteriota bacterium]